MNSLELLGLLEDREVGMPFRAPTVATTSLAGMFCDSDGNEHRGVHVYNA